MHVVPSKHVLTVNEDLLDHDIGYDLGQTLDALYVIFGAFQRGERPLEPNILRTSERIVSKSLVFQASK